jgi:hypothetical protein
VIERALLIVNAESGTGCGPSLPAELARSLGESSGVANLEMAVIRDHPAARRAAAAFATGGDRPAAVIAGGGGGTLRAIVEGLYDAGAAERVVAGALRMGSGNVLAKRLGIAREPLTGIRQLGAAIVRNSTEQRPVIRCRWRTESGVEDVRHAVVMCGLGQWGRCPGDLARWHRRLPRARAALAALAGLERVNHVEYAAAAAGRLVQAAVRPRSCELVEASFCGVRESYRLLAGTAMTLPIGGIPFDPRVRPGEAAAGIVLVPRGGRPRRLRLTTSNALSISLADRESVELFLDEDPEIAHRRISIDVAGTVAFLRPDPQEVAA